MSQLVPFGEYHGEQEESLMFATMFDFLPDDEKKPLASFDGLNSGVPTRTTATLTPTHLRNIEQTFIELQTRGESGAHHAGFVPPPVATHANPYGFLGTASYGVYGGSEMGAGSLPLHVSPGPGSSGDSSSCSLPPAPVKRRNMGGRRPTKAPADISPEEEARRLVRRERNKMAAARCRKRRLDHTNELANEVEGLERKRQELQEELGELNNHRSHLESVLEQHRAKCRLHSATPPDVKPPLFSERRAAPPPLPAMPAVVSVKVETVDAMDGHIGLDSDIFTSPHSRQKTMLSAVSQIPSLEGPLNTPPAPAPRMPRPSSLHVQFPFPPGQLYAVKTGAAELAGIDISTPSSALPFNFDSLMEGGTGLTPVQACATQHKSLPEMLSPETPQSNKLVTL